MNLSTVIPLARKPTVRLMTQDILDTEFGDDVKGDRLVSLYLPEPQAQVMIRTKSGDPNWVGSWAPISKADALECAREHAFKYKTPHNRNLFYVVRDPAGENTRYLLADVDAGSECLDVDTLGAHIDAGDDAMVVLFDPAKRAVQQYRIRDNYVLWWWKSCPHTRDAAIRIADNSRYKHRLSFDALHFYDVGIKV